MHLSVVFVCLVFCVLCLVLFLCFGSLSRTLLDEQFDGTGLAVDLLPTATATLARTATRFGACVTRRTKRRVGEEQEELKRRSVRA